MRLKFAQAAPGWPINPSARLNAKVERRDHPLGEGNVTRGFCVRSGADRGAKIIKRFRIVQRQRNITGEFGDDLES